MSTRVAQPSGRPPTSRRGRRSARTDSGAARKTLSRFSRAKAGAASVAAEAEALRGGGLPLPLLRLGWAWAGGGGGCK